MPKHPADALAYRFDEWSPDGKTLVETHAFIGDWEVAQAAWAALIKAKPHDRLTCDTAPWSMPSSCRPISSQKRAISGRLIDYNLTEELLKISKGCA